ncbi:Lon family ATP-dependent protease [Desulfosporosinus nitroreducens]|uniref:endopeptidase La n=1 Tax=Desulfosporosinus nitroreducens TaxID=2018668 RepID=A0ABT8QRX5_9FIRM|nr:Lon family ATP-dependent protease [Desulfosporosinus nitroreducens]MCO1601450.1 Lon family ATP-dependent protease [Desulfosporosinus nitroreducens]MDO0824030.1 Lon family ATP-dependent protease [Desulfosporosinus nitroreducens]
MKGILTKWLNQTNLGDRLQDEEEWIREVEALYVLLSNYYGTDKLVLKASRLEALKLMRSDELVERVAGLRKIVSDDPTAQQIPKMQEIPQILDEIEEQIADLIARRAVEDRLERVVSEKMQERHQDYVKEIKMNVLKETAGPENAQTLKKLAILEKMNTVSLKRSAFDVLRPQTVEEIVGQESSVQALLAKLATPYPQHMLIYGPPGVGKTSAARVALETVKNRPYSPFTKDAPFIEVDGTTLRWDPRDVTNPLLGSVHDPIYQGAKHDLADTGIPEPKMGLVSDAHGGILFIDEIGEMDPLLLNKLLKVLEDKRAFFDSSYYDPGNSQVPQWIKKLFDEGAPADFVLIGATTRDPAELNPALRSRCSEVFFVPLEPRDVQHIIRQAGDKLGVSLEDNVPEIISEYVIEGRKANSILTDAYGLARYRNPEQEEVRVTSEDVYEVLRSARLTPFIFRKVQSNVEIGRVLGLGVAGFLGSVLEIEAITFTGQDGKGTIRFNETAGSMARDAVFNAAAVIRDLTGEDLRNYDVHVNIIGGAKIDGPSAGLATTLAIYSALKKQPLRQDVAVTGEISIQGKVKPVGGIYEKIFGAKQVEVRKVLIPFENMADVPLSLQGIEVVPVRTIEEAMSHVFDI